MPSALVSILRSALGDEMYLPPAFLLRCEREGLEFSSLGLTRGLAAVPAAERGAAAGCCVGGRLAVLGSGWLSSQHR